mmetsp:Transcript_22515/g.67568  ORF Transcript_22515/g.67568 Transcript_22515/m.67568 type:complete len:267 (-) Transcript_22515:624-1424(-)
MRSLASSTVSIRPPSRQHRRKSTTDTRESPSSPAFAATIRRWRRRFRASTRCDLDVSTFRRAARSALVPPQDGWRETSQPRGANAHQRAAALAGDAGKLSGRAHSKMLQAVGSIVARIETPVSPPTPNDPRATSERRRDHSIHSYSSAPSIALSRPPTRRQYRTAAVAPRVTATCAGDLRERRQPSARARPCLAALQRSNSRLAFVRRLCSDWARDATYLESGQSFAQTTAKFNTVLHLSRIASKLSTLKSPSAASRAASKFPRST